MAATTDLDSKKHNHQLTPVIAMPEYSESVTASDTTETDYAGVYVGGAGDLAVKLWGDSTAVTLVGLQAGTFIPLRVKSVMSTNTTATNIVGFKY